MPRTVDEGFRDFLAKLTPSAVESDAAKRHRASIKACLENNYTLYRFVRIGSFGNGTSISGFSDVDYLAQVSSNNLSSDSTYSMNKLRNTLGARFPQTGVCVRCPTVHVPFGSLARDATEIVLAFNTQKSSNGHTIYGIPDCAGKWMNAAPDAHNAYVLSQDKRLNNKVRPLIRFIKAWKYYRNVPISSFYLEMRAAKYASDETTILYNHDIPRFLNWLQDMELARMQDPCGVSGYIYACKTTAQAEDAISKLKTAATRASNALACQQANKISDAFDWWRLLYNDAFPSYYRY